MRADAPQVPTVVVGETRNGRLSFANLLDSGELLTGTPTLTEIGTTHMTFSNVSVTTAAMEVNDVQESAGTVVTFKVVGFQGDRMYRVIATAPTNSTPAQELKKIFHLICAPST